MIKIKSKETLKFKMPISITEYEFMSRDIVNYYSNDPKAKNFFFGLQIDPINYINRIPKTTIDSLEQTGYKLYRNKINSNKVNFVLDK